MRVWLLLLRLVPAALTALAAVRIAGVEFGAWSAVWWDIPLAVVAAISLFAESVTTNIVDAAMSRSRRREEELEKVIKSTLRVVCVRIGVDYSELGVSIMKSRRGLVRWIRRQPAALRRVKRYRISNHPPVSTVHWESGKGVIGICFASGQIEHRDLNSMWSGKGPRDRLGLSEAEYREVKDKYAEILAVPLRRGDPARVIGVLSVDLPKSVAVAGAGTLLNDVDVVSAATYMADVVVGVV